MIGSRFADILVDINGDNVIEGYGGADTFRGNGGSDTISFAHDDAGAVSDFQAGATSRTTAV